MSKSYIYDITGKKFGKITVIKFIERPEKTESYWLCRCECGNEVILDKHTINYKERVNTGCGCKKFGICSDNIRSRKISGRRETFLKKAKKELIGKKFNKLEILDIVYNKEKSRNEAICRCDCGNITKIETTRIKKYKVISCGCIKVEVHKKRRKKFIDPPREELYRQYKYSAKKRDFEFSISIETAYKLFDSNCYYCGAEPSNLIIVYGEKKLYSGIDRVNSKIGYTEENCVSCCKKCNIMKNTLAKDEFFEKISDIFYYNNLGDVYGQS